MIEIWLKNGHFFSNKTMKTPKLLKILRDSWGFLTDLHPQFNRNPFQIRKSEANATLGSSKNPQESSRILKNPQEWTSVPWGHSNQLGFFGIFRDFSGFSWGFFGIVRDIKGFCTFFVIFFGIWRDFLGIVRDFWWYSGDEIELEGCVGRRSLVIGCRINNYCYFRPEGT